MTRWAMESPSSVSGPAVDGAALDGAGVRAASVPSDASSERTMRSAGGAIGSGGGAKPGRDPRPDDASGDGTRSEVARDRAATSRAASLGRRKTGGSGRLGASDERAARGSPTETPPLTERPAAEPGAAGGTDGDDCCIPDSGRTAGVRALAADGGGEEASPGPRARRFSIETIEATPDGEFGETGLFEALAVPPGTPTGPLAGAPPGSLLGVELRAAPGWPEVRAGAGYPPGVRATERGSDALRPILGTADPGRPVGVSAPAAAAPPVGPALAAGVAEVAPAPVDRVTDDGVPAVGAGVPRPGPCAGGALVLVIGRRIAGGAGAAGATDGAAGSSGVTVLLAAAAVLLAEGGVLAEDGADGPGAAGEPGAGRWMNLGGAGQASAGDNGRRRATPVGRRPGTPDERSPTSTPTRPMTDRASAPAVGRTSEGAPVGPAADAAPAADAVDGTADADRPMASAWDAAGGPDVADAWSGPGEDGPPADGGVVAARSAMTS
ncbi:MAG: hypothetical protein AB7F65_02615 [Dehalococcoidia bacterium]